MTIAPRPGRRFSSALLSPLALLLAAASALGETPPPQLSPPSPPAVLVDLPFELSGGMPVIAVKVDGQGPFRFAVDTGGEGQARAAASLVARLGLPVVGEALGVDGSRGGTARPMPVVRLGTLEIGGLTFRDVTAPSRDYNLGGQRPGGPIDGILGFGLFAGHLLTIDYPAGRLRVETGSLGPVDGKEVLPITVDRGVPVLRLELGGRQVDADVDTGSMGGLQLPAALASTLPLAAPPVPFALARTVSRELVLSQARFKGTVQLGRHALASPLVAFTEGFDHANLGSELLRHFALTFDQKGSRMRLVRAGDAPITMPPRRTTGLVLRPTPGGLEVALVATGGPAEKAGVAQGDRVLAVEGRPVEAWPPGQIRERLGSPEPVTLRLGRGETTLEARIVPIEI